MSRSRSRKRHILGLCTAAFLVSTSMTVPAKGAPIVALIAGPAFAATIGGQLLGVGISLAVSFLGNQLLNAIMPKPHTPAVSTIADTAKTSEPQLTQVQYGERVSRSGVFGTTLVGGHVVLYNEYSDATHLEVVSILGDMQHSGIVGVYVDGRQYAIAEVATSGNNEHHRYTVDTFGSVIDLRMHDGRSGQAADSALVVHNTGWDTTKKYSGMAYVIADVTSDREKFNGIPEFKWVVAGLKCYDIRKDTTSGGSGSHRFNDPATWEYTANPAVQAYHFCRGFFFNGRRVLGIGYSSAELNADTFIAAMNVCDEDVSVPGGGTRKRYECHMAFEDTDQFSDVLDRLTEAMGGYHTELQGQVCVYAGAAQAVVTTITDGDLVVDEDCVFDPGLPGEFLPTGISGTYIHSSEFTPTPYESIEPSAFVNSNWYPHTITQDYEQVKSAHQAWLLSKQKLYEQRLQATAQIVLDIKDVMIQGGDWITWASTGVRDTRTYRVTRCAYDYFKMRMALSLKEISTDVFDDDATADTVAEPDRTRPISGYLSTVSGFGVHAITLAGASGETLPALEFDYDPIFDPAVQGVEIFYRIKGGVVDSVGNTQTEGDIFRTVDRSVDDGTTRVTNGAQPGYKYEAYAHLISLPGRAVTDTAWTEADDFTGTFGAVVAVGDATITLAKLSQDVQNLLGLLTGTDAGSIWSTLQAVNDEIERQANAAYTLNATFARQTTLLERRYEGAAAAVIHEQEVRATADQALASDITQVLAGLDTALASGLLKLEATTDGIGAEASIAAKVRVTTAAAYSEAAWIIQATADGLGGTTSVFGVFADLFFVADSLGNLTQAMTYESGELKVLAARVGTITAGLIQNAAGTVKLDIANMRFYRTDGTFDIDGINKRIKITS